MEWSKKKINIGLLVLSLLLHILRHLEVITVHGLLMIELTKLKTLKKATNYISSDSAEYAFLTQNI